MIHEDFIYVPRLDKQLEDGDGLGRHFTAAGLLTRTNFYYIPDNKVMNDKFWKDLLTSTTRTETINYNGKLAWQLVDELSQTPGISAQEMEAFVDKMMEDNKQIEKYPVAEMTKIKAFKGFLGSGGNVAIKRKGKAVYKSLYLSIPKPYNVAVKEFCTKIELKN